MDNVTKIITALGAGIAVAAAIGVIMSWLKLKEGLESEDARNINKGALGLALNGVTLVLIGGLVAFVIAKLTGIVG
ncbi:hypothetical protein [Lactococcus lactis]|uniref:hypothetical protein n=1 Tax=Lactococcus lactis TaxID=1358 RepID=UPI0019128CDC|nr:hypothetical protein [Lactococcus lactis]MCT0449124.1 hypothetical protein [Lactococcus lactis subsp. lactis]WDA67317.1 hypothetical protein IL310_00125 [Lactococcus lactis]